MTENLRRQDEREGKLTKVSSPVSTTEYTGFDILGRVTASKQTTDGTDYTSAYAYNLSGALIEQTYPSGRRVQNTLDADGSLEMVTSRKNANSGYWAYANNFSYNAAGAVTSMQLGNGSWESAVFNSRLQPTQIALGTVKNGTDKLDLGYTYGTTNNNGNVLTQTITVPTVGSNNGFTATQAYTYDSLNRIYDAKEMIGTTETWKQTFVYDRFGNRTFDTTLNRTTTIPTGCPVAVCNPSADPSNNKLVGYQFDGAGNTKIDAESRTFVYDAENKQVEVKNSASQTIGQYFYDGDGRRVKKVVPSTGEVTVFVYDAASKLIAEYSTIVEPSSTAKVAYLTNDHLGSPRINTDKNGNVTARHDYHPFGEETATSQRTTGLGYTADTVRKQFTGYAHDGETEFDFAQARMFATRLGRFTSTDPATAQAPVEPQNWNKYAYVLNSPLKMVDPDGNWPTVIHNLIFRLALPGLTNEEMSEVQKGSYSVDFPFTVFGFAANDHGMCKPRQDPFDCAADSLAAQNRNLNSARNLNLLNDGDENPRMESLYYFGRGNHTPQDIGSPAHGFQVYDDRYFLLCVAGHLGACLIYDQERRQHDRLEANITSAQLLQQISQTRDYFRSIYPTKTYERAVGIFATADFSFVGQIDGFSLPTVNFNDLGTVTVHADGTEEYKGPLKKCKRNEECS